MRDPVDIAFRALLIVSAAAGVIVAAPSTGAGDTITIEKARDD